MSKLAEKIGSKTQGATLEKEAVPKHHPQGQPANPGARSDRRKELNNVGTSYAMAVDNVKQSAQKGSDIAFMGVEKKSLSPHDQVNREMLYKGKNKK